MTASLPSLADWQARAQALGLKKQGRELVGPCPACGGTDRFRVGPRGAFCRQCCPDGSDPAALRRLIEAAGFAWPDSANRREGPFKARTAAKANFVADTPRKNRAGDPGHGFGGQRGESRGHGGRQHGQSGGSDARQPPPEAVSALWAAATGDPDSTRPIAANLDSRRAWPLAWPLPAAIRWLPGEYLARRRNDWPAEAAGAACYAFADPATGRLCGLQLEPLARDGRRVSWPNGRSRLTAAGSRMRGAAFMVRVKTERGRDAPLHVAEGVTDALAIRCWRGVEAWAAGGTNFPALANPLAATGRPIVVEADSGQAGQASAARLFSLLHARGAACRIERATDDPAADLAALAGGADDWLAAWARFQERAASLEFECDLDRAAAERQAAAELRPAGFEAGPGAIEQSPSERTAGNDR